VIATLTYECCAYVYAFLEHFLRNLQSPFTVGAHRTHVTKKTAMLSCRAEKVERRMSHRRHYAANASRSTTLEIYSFSGVFCADQEMLFYLFCSYSKGSICAKHGKQKLPKLLSSSLYIINFCVLEPFGNKDNFVACARKRKW
jgi:hypothetical protein